MWQKFLRFSNLLPFIIFNRTHVKEVTITESLAGNSHGEVVTDCNKTKIKGFIMESRKSKPIRRIFPISRILNPRDYVACNQKFLHRKPAYAALEVVCS